MTAPLTCRERASRAKDCWPMFNAARSCALLVAISFTLETDGRLPSGDTLAQAITRTDGEIGDFAAYYMINCDDQLRASHLL
jgi:S-methylmethionine-dependent homocysteine/selenocysteine methylase